MRCSWRSIFYSLVLLGHFECKWGQRSIHTALLIITFESIWKSIRQCNTCKTHKGTVSAEPVCTGIKSILWESRYLLNKGIWWQVVFHFSFPAGARSTGCKAKTKKLLKRMVITLKIAISLSLSFSLLLSHLFSSSFPVALNYKTLWFLVTFHFSHKHLLPRPPQHHHQISVRKKEPI